MNINMELVGNAMRYMTFAWKWGGRILGYGLVLLFYALVMVLGYCYFFEIGLIFYMVHKSKVMIALGSIFGLWIMFNVLFNYTLAMLVSPGKSFEFEVTHRHLSPFMQLICRS